MKKKMPPLYKWTLERLKKRITRLYTPKRTAGEIIGEVKNICEKAKIKLDVEFTKYPNHAMELAKVARNKYDLVIVAGGDGTINEVINGLANSKVTLAIIPFGSTNVLALELGIPYNLKKAAKLIIKGKKIKMDLGYAQTSTKSRYFSTMLSVGFDAHVIKNMDSKFKKKWGRLSYLLGGIKHLFIYKWHDIHVKNIKNSAGYFVIIANSKYYAGEYQIADKANIQDGLLDLVIINRKKIRHIIRIILSLTMGKLNTFLKEEYSQTKEAHIYSHKKMWVQVDGELMGLAPVKVKVVPKALNIMGG